MSSFELVLIFIIVFLLLVLKSKYDTRKIVKETPIYTPLQIAWKSENIIGVYKNINISDKIKTVDGRMFEYESVAVQSTKFPGVFLSDDPASTYMLIDSNLLYKEIKQ